MYRRDLGGAASNTAARQGRSYFNHDETASVSLMWPAAPVGVTSYMSG